MVLSAEDGVCFKLDTGALVSVIAYNEPIVRQVDLTKSNKVQMGRAGPDGVTRGHLNCGALCIDSPLVLKLSLHSAN